MLRLITVASSLAFLAVPALASSIDYDVPPFTSIKASNGVVLRVVAGGQQRVTASAGNAAALASLQLTVVDGNLIVGFDTGFLGFDFMGGNVVTVNVEMPVLDDVSGSAGSQIGVEGISSQAMRLEVAMGAKLLINGTCGSATVSVHEGGTLDARTLECDIVTVNATMGGMASVFARDRAVIDASSGASVDVYGDPAHYIADDSLGAVIQRFN
jgi:hypothetical protein